MSNEYPMRLNKYMSHNNMCSRREADRLIKNGRVTINDTTAVLGDKVNKNDTVKITEGVMYKRIYLAFNKPTGIITHSPGPGEKCITDIITTSHRVFPVGRLDKDSHGLIILTNDGLITKRLLEPDKGIEKEYIVHVDKPITEAFLIHMEEGVKLDNGYVTKPCRIKKLDKNVFNIILTEGKKRQIRRMCEALGYTVTDLQRIRIANIHLDDIPVGEYQPITGTELKRFLAHIDL